jgi:preprotein translocase subunit SecE
MASDPRDPQDGPDDPPEANRPGELEHASGEVDEFEAATRAGGLEGPAAAGPAPGAPTTGGSGPRFLNFLRACWAELQRVQWPDRRQVGQATAVVLGFVVIAGTYLGVADRLAQELVDIII